MTAERIPERSQLLAAARALAPLVEAGAEEAERAGTLPSATVEALRGAGLFRVLLPRALGGFEADPLTAIEVFEEIGRQDGSAGWCTGNSAVIGGIAGGRLCEAAAKRVFDGPGVILAGGYTPRGEAQRVPGGYRVHGRFKFGSGCRHATWIVAASPLPRPDGSSELRAFCLPPERVEIHDNWRAAGLEGTASCDYSLHDEHVPEELSFELLGPPARGGALYRVPLVPFAYIAHTGFALGVGRRALEEALARAGVHKRYGASAPLSQRPVFQQELARSDSALRAARLLVLDRFAELWAAHRAGHRPSLELRAGVAGAALHAVRAAERVAEFALRSAGASALYRSDAVQRCFRDLRAGMQHMAVADEVWERVGQVLLGLGDEAMLI
jgi:alkylation response protein AidB-like acyl-CoA dehydrogenase